MEVIIFIGIQATGKSSLYKERFFKSHVHLSLDLLNTRHKFNRFMQTCLDTQSKFVVDNTNLTKEERSPLIELTKARKYKVVGYYFSSSIEESLNRNEKREGKERIPDIAIKGSYSKLELPSYEEGFDELFYVKIEEGRFNISTWQNEI